MTEYEICNNGLFESHECKFKLSEEYKNLMFPFGDLTVKYACSICGNVKIQHGFFDGRDFRALRSQTLEVKQLPDLELDK